MKWDRTERIGVGLYLALSTVTAYLSLRSSGAWHYELARATDAAGQYLFFTTPLLLALCALSAQRRAALTRDLAPALPQPDIGARATWMKFAAVASVFHLCAIGATVTVALYDDAAHVISYQPFMRQFLLIVGMAAAGGLLGPVARSVALPGVVMILTLFVAVLLPFTGVREFLLAGAGTFDFSFQRYSYALLLLGVLVAAGMMLPTVPWRSVSRRVNTVRIVAANTALAVAAVLMVSGSAYGLVNAKPTEICQIQAPKVCGPQDLDQAIMEAADASQRVLRDLPPSARTFLPSTLTLRPAAERSTDPATVEFETAMFGDPGAVERSVIFTLAGQHACSPDLPPSILRGQVLGSAAIAGWLQRRSGVDADGTYPKQLVLNLERYSPAKQQSVVAEILKQVWACGQVNLGSIE